MFKGLTGLNPRNQAFKQFKCSIHNVLKQLGQKIHASKYEEILNKSTKTQILA